MTRRITPILQTQHYPQPSLTYDALKYLPTFNKIRQSADELPMIQQIFTAHFSEEGGGQFCLDYFSELGKPNYTKFGEAIAPL